VSRAHHPLRIGAPARRVRVDGIPDRALVEFATWLLAAALAEDRAGQCAARTATALREHAKECRRRADAALHEGVLREHGALMPSTSPIVVAELSA
jgi:hypothetical protein